MDYLDPKYERRHRNLLYIGYVLIAIAIYLAVRLLLEISVGYGYKDGQVVQYGTVFVSSAPSGAAISLDGKSISKNTNSRLSLQSGDYIMRLTRNGYRSWQQSVQLNGGAIQRFDYPLLIPTQPETTVTESYDAQPLLMTQSPDQRWLLVLQPGSDTKLDQFDLRDPATPQTLLEIPSTIYSAGATESITASEWSNDNKHVLLKRTYDSGKIEYVMVNRDDPTQSFNLTTRLNTTMIFVH